MLLAVLSASRGAVPYDECAMRLLALNFSRHLLPWSSGQEAFDALDISDHTKRAVKDVYTPVWKELSFGWRWIRWL